MTLTTEYLRLQQQQQQQERGQTCPPPGQECHQTRVWMW